MKKVLIELIIVSSFIVIVLGIGYILAKLLIVLATIK